MGENYQKLMEREIGTLNTRPKLMLLSCCGPCSSYVLECLVPHFKVTVCYYNSNIFPPEEYYKRLDEQKRLLEKMELSEAVDITPTDYDSEKWGMLIKGLEGEPEGGARCAVCFEMRMREAARLAAEQKCDYFCATLSVSPHKNAELINEIGMRLAGEYGVKWLQSDFKKKNGYKRSVELSRQYGVYRQDYCGCVFSMGLPDGEENNGKLPGDVV